MSIKPLYITFEQSKILKEKGFDDYNEHIYRPQQWEVLEWLRINHNIWVSVDSIGGEWFWSIYKHEDNFETKQLSESNVNFINPQEAYSAAFDYTLDNLL